MLILPHPFLWEVPISGHYTFSSHIYPFVVAGERYEPNHVVVPTHKHLHHIHKAILAAVYKSVFTACRKYALRKDISASRLTLLTKDSQENL
mmetsp:Transcript_8434/g.10994  ORF Transcript_8434/g.10994 Transcript_8434/m.10994 type:complete len:92 (+) Transcript_8434:1649-1924(+)